jgi:hypothetical protein
MARYIHVILGIFFPEPTEEVYSRLSNNAHLLPTRHIYPEGFIHCVQDQDHQKLYLASIFFRFSSL